MQRISLLLLLIIPLTSLAQVGVNQSSIDFGDVKHEGNTRGVKSISVENKFAIPVNIEIVSFNDAFSSELSNLNIEANSSRSIDLYFDPSTNIQYNSEVIIRTHTFQGDIAIDVNGSGRFDNTYYSSTYDLFEEDLKAELKRVISKSTVSLGYTRARDAMYATIDNVGGGMTCVYTGRQANFTSRSGANSNNFNCEHTYPQSKFSSREPEKSDIHHLFPTYSNANSQRGNLPFGEVSSASYEDGGSKKGNGVFEVRDDHKGNTARAMMYFGIRYGNYDNFLTSQESALRNWHKGDLPDSEEEARNEAIFGSQKNRNPFVDHPQFVDRIQSIASTSNAPLIKSWNLSSDSMVEESALEIDWTSLYVVNSGNTLLNFEVPTEKEGLGNVVFESDQAFSVAPGESHEVKFKSNIVDVAVLSSIILIKSGNQTKEVKVEMRGAAGSINELIDNRNIWFYEGTLRIQDVESGILEILSVDGKQVHFSEIRGALTEFNTSELPSGIYIAFVDSGERRMSLRFIVP